MVFYDSSTFMYMKKSVIVGGPDKPAIPGQQLF